MEIWCHIEVKHVLDMFQSLGYDTNKEYYLNITIHPEYDCHKLYSACISTTSKGGTKVTMNDWDIRLSVAVKTLSANISRMAEQIHTIELALESAHQSVYNDI